MRDKHPIDYTLSDMDISVRLANALASNKFTTIREIISIRVDELPAYRDFGKKSLDELVGYIHSLGLKFGYVEPPPTISNEQEQQLWNEAEKAGKDIIAPHRGGWINGYVAGRKATTTAKDKEIAELKERLVKVAGDEAEDFLSEAPDFVKNHTGHGNNNLATIWKKAVQSERKKMLEKLLEFRKNEI